MRLASNLENTCTSIHAILSIGKIYKGININDSQGAIFRLMTATRYTLSRKSMLIQNQDHSA